MWLALWVSSSALLLLGERWGGSPSAAVSGSLTWLGGTAVRTAGAAEPEAVGSIGQSSAPLAASSPLLFDLSHGLCLNRRDLWESLLPALSSGSLGKGLRLGLPAVSASSTEQA